MSITADANRIIRYVYYQLCSLYKYWIYITIIELIIIWFDSAVYIINGINI